MLSQLEIQEIQHMNATARASQDARSFGGVNINSTHEVGYKVPMMLKQLNVRTTDQSDTTMAKMSVCQPRLWLVKLSEEPPEGLLDDANMSQYNPYCEAAQDSRGDWCGHAQWWKL